MPKITHINSKLYNELFLEGGDNLIAVYAMLKSGKNGGIKIYKEDRNIYHTLKSKTTLSVTTLRKYIKVLIAMGLCHFDLAGNFVLAGNNKINKEYKKRKIKLIRIEIGTYQQTKLNSFVVRLKTMQILQEKAIQRKSKQKQIKARDDKGYYLTPQERKFLNFCEKKEVFDGYYNANISLSNYGFSKLKHGATKSKGSGEYWKRKLVKNNIIETKREFQFLRKASYEDYRKMRWDNKSLVYSNGSIYIELVSSFRIK